MRARKRLSASNATAFVLLVIGGVVAINLIATRVFGRLDLTENKVYTLSQASKDVVRNLPDYLTVKAYISKDLPAELTTISRYVRDLLDEYRTYSKGKLRFEAIDPGADKKLEEEAAQCKVQPIQIQVLRSQKFEVGSYYLGLCFQYQGKNEAITGDRRRGVPRVPGLLAGQADDPAEAQAGLHHRTRRGGPQPGLHADQADRRARVRDHHRQSLVGRHRRRRRRAGRRWPQAGRSTTRRAARSTPS